MAAQPDVREKERSDRACVAKAYEGLDLGPGVNPNGPAWSGWPSSSGSFVGRHRTADPSTHRIRTAPRRRSARGRRASAAASDRAGDHLEQPRGHPRRPRYPSSQRSSASSPPRCPVTATRSAITGLAAAGGRAAFGRPRRERGPAGVVSILHERLTGSGSNRKAERGSSDICDSPAEQPREPEHPHQGDADQTGPTRKVNSRTWSGVAGNVAQLKQAVLRWPPGQDVGQHDRDVVIDSQSPCRSIPR